MRHQIVPWVVPSTLRWFGEGAHCTDAKSGSMILVRHPGPVAYGVALGQRALALTDKGMRPYCWSDHVAWLRRAEGGEHLFRSEWRARPRDLIVSEMGPRGHEYRPLKSYQDRLYCVVEFDVPRETYEVVLRADDACAAIDYGFLEYPALVLNSLGVPFGMSLGASMICSTEVATCGTNAFWFMDRQSSDVAPAHLSELVGAIPPRGLL